MPLLSLLACASGDGTWPGWPGVPTPDPHMTLDDPPPVVDVHRIGEPEVPVDVLVAVDPEQVARAVLEVEVLPSLVEMLRLFDPSWRVAVTSTALGDLDEVAHLLPTGGDGDPWLSEEDLDQLLVDWTDVPAAHPWGAMGATYLTATADPHGFHRPEATLYLVLLQIDQGDDTPESVVTFDAWSSWVQETEAVVSAVADDGAPLRDVVAGSGGVAVEPYGDRAAWASTIGFLPGQVPLSYPLSLLPVVDTLHVRVDLPSGVVFDFSEAMGDPPVGDWIYRGTENSVAFMTFVPESGSTVRLTYVPRGGR
jgi:hypothetical protein